MIFLNGDFLDPEDAKVSVFDHGFLYGDGVYETMRTYDGAIFNLTSHYDRLKNSADFLGLNLPMSEQELKKIVKELLAKNSLSNARIRVTLTRGDNDFDFSTCKNPTVCITAIQLKEEAKDVYEKGVKVVTVPFCRVIPEVKSISMVPLVRAKQEMVKKGAYEALFMDDKGHVTEGSVTNVYFVYNNEIHVPELDVLSGTVRKIILDLAFKADYSVVFERCYKESFYEADEIFLTNAIIGIVPVSHIDDFPVNQSVPGPVTKSLMDMWKEVLPKYLT